MERALPMKLPVLPIYYYLNHFIEMLQFVETTYGTILTEEHLHSSRASTACQRTPSVC
jgi:hypothetical protein